jgi:hypothetical protein
MVSPDWSGPGPSNLCLAVVARAEHALLGVGTATGSIQVWDITSLAAPQRLAAFRAHNGGIAMLKFDPRGQTLMSSTLRPGECGATLNNDEFQVLTGMNLSPDTDTERRSRHLAFAWALDSTLTATNQRSSPRSTIWNCRGLKFRRSASNAPCGSLGPPPG